MGWAFEIRHSNLVAYLTSQRPCVPPRVTKDQLIDFLKGLSGEVTPTQLISSSKDWIVQVQRTARDALQFVEPMTESPDLTQRALATLRPLLGSYNLFALAVGSSEAQNRFVQFAALDSRHHALFLMPGGASSTGYLHFLDPFPAIGLLVEHIGTWPGVVFWSPHGSVAFAPMNGGDPVGEKGAYDLYAELRQVLDQPNRIDEVLEGYRCRNTAKRILHLSDVHFGTDASLENEAFLSAHLQSVSKTLDKVVITGDLFNEPKREPALAFRNFRASLSRQRGESVTVIPGNHDHKWMGNFGSPLREMAKLEWSNLVVEDAIRCVFFCFDSSRDADWARGKVTTEQLPEVATDFETKALARPEIRDYLFIALVHHHPFMGPASIRGTSRAIPL